jgi:autotransporter-associated beta strand protein
MIMKVNFPTSDAAVSADELSKHTQKIMKTTPNRIITQAAGVAALATLFALGLASSRAQDIWKGTGPDANWLTSGNWQGGTAPTPGDSLIFTNTIGLNNTNNFPSATTFNHLTFATPAGAFALAGNQVTLNGNITNKQPVTVEFINLPLALAVTPIVDVASDGVLAINGVISGSGGLTKTGAGELDLNAANTFTGPLMLNGGTVVVSSDSNLGHAPDAPTARSLVLDGGGLETTANVTLNANRVIAVGPSSGTITVDIGTTLSYAGSMDNGGGAGGLTKDGYGTLALSGASTYSGPTTNLTGTLLLDFTQPGSPPGSIINASSSLVLGGGNAGAGAENVAQLIMAGKGGTPNSQFFSGAHFTFGGSAIVATNGTGGTAYLALGALSHDAGGTVVLVSSVGNGGGIITTTSTNLNGILGGWALISGDRSLASSFTVNGHTLLTGTNFATVDTSGDIVNYTGYTNYSFGGTLNSQILGSIGPNFTINDPSSAQVATVNNNNAGTTTDVNAVKWLTSSAGFDGIFIGAGNTLRLGKYGGIIRNGPTSGNAMFIGGVDNSLQSGTGVIGSQNIGTLTAGGADNTDGEIVCVVNNPSETSGTTCFESKIADNGTGKVTFVKMGPGSIKLDGHNTFSGGLYLLQGRVQFTGSEIGSAATTGNPDGGGTGPIYVLPGAYLFPSGFPAGRSITNVIFLAGNGDAAEPLGAIRGGVFSGPVNLIGDANVGATTVMNGAITGPFSLTLGSAATVNGGATLVNSNNNWTGNTILTARSDTGDNVITCSNNEVIPDGFGKGNVSMQGFGTGTVHWDLHGFNETINGLSSSNGSTCFIQNNVATTVSTLTIGNNDQSGTFGGLLQNNGGTLALTKIGGGVETLTSANTYTGPTIVNSGTLAISGSGSIATSSQIQVNSGGTLDVSALNGGFSTANPVGVAGGNITGNGSVGNLSLTNGALSLDINTAGTNIIATGLATGGTTNLININTIAGVTKYPASFTIIQYSGALGGAGNNFGLGDVPSAITTGFVSNSVASSRIILVLLNGPKVLNWTGNNAVNPTFWDVATTTNWLAFKGTVDQAPSTFNKADAVTFDDTGSSSTVNVVLPLSPGLVGVTNNSLNYIFTGSGGIVGKLSMTKDGTGSLLLDNGGNSGVSISGTFTINKGTVQVGNNDNNGSISATAGVVDKGALVFIRSDNVTNNSSISGTGSLTQNSAAVLTLSGNNSFSGGANVVLGTLQAGSNTALGSTNGTTTVSSGATLDVGGQTLNTYPVVVSGTGVGGNGAIINSVADTTTAMGNVTLANNTTFGGTRRWDIRGGAAQLLTGGNAYNLTKKGTNQISLVGVTVDGNLGDINVQSGTFSVETTTSGLGNSGNTLTVASGATFNVYGTVNTLFKQFALNGNGVAATFYCANGAANTLAGNITLTGNCIFSATNGTAVAFSSGTMSGTGSLTITGSGTNIISSSETASYTGGTLVTNGTLVVDGTLSGSVRIAPTATLAGTGTASGTVTVTNATVSPGDIAATPQGTLTVGPLTLSNSTVVLELGTAPTAGNNDKVVVTGALTLSGTGTNTLQIVPLSYINVGDVFTNIQYSGALPSSITNFLRVVSSRAGFAFHIVDPGTTPGLIEIRVDAALGNDLWTGLNSANWDTNTINWTRNGGGVTFNNADYVTFNDSSSVNNVNLVGALSVSGMTMLNGAKNYQFIGTGSLTNSGTLQLNGGGTVTIANTGTNNFQGLTTISSGILQLGNGGTGGNLGSGIITNNSSLVFNRSDNALSVNGAIGGSGSLTNIGTGMVTLGGANGFDGEVDVLHGTLRVANSAALGDTFGATVVSDGATLDITNNANVGNESITVSGAGVGGNGVIVNSSSNSTFIGPNFRNLTITTNITVGGTGRLDMRASSASAADGVLFCSPFGQPYTLTKVGTNQFQMSGVTIDPGLGNIDVQAGTFGLQWQMPDLGNASYSLIMHSNTTLNLFDLSNTVAKVFILTNATVYNQHGTNILNGPFTLAGTNTFNIANNLTVVGSIKGSGGVVKTGTAILLLSTGPESYTGDTIVNGGTLALAEPANLTNSPHIILSGGTTVDVSGRTDGKLTLGGGGLPQVLAGGGTINGTLVENSGSTVNPGNGVAPAVLTVTNGVALNGTVIMDLNRASGAVTNDQIMVISNLSLTVSGPLIVTNLGPNLVAGDTFQLFSVPVSGFSSKSLPGTNGLHTVAYNWQDNLAANGSITVLSTTILVNTNSTSITFSAGGGNLTLSWPSDHTGWTLQAQTNSLAKGLGTNWVAVSGSNTTNSITVPINGTNGAVFYRLTYP